MQIRPTSVDENVCTIWMSGCGSSLDSSQKMTPPSNQVTGTTDGFNCHCETCVTAGKCTERRALGTGIAAVHFHFHVIHVAPLRPTPH